MSRVVAGQKSRKKQSPFEKLWARAAKLKQKNEKFSADLDALVARIDREIKPLEVELVGIQIPLLQKLLTLGQRKSMTNWERETLDEWIKELVEETHLHGQINNELLDDIARYDAFRMGITLEDDSIAPHQQFVEMMKQADEARAEEMKRQHEELQKEIEESKAELIKEAERQVEREIVRILGQEPKQPETHSATSDLWADELEVELQQQRAEYRARSEQLREQLMAQKIADIDSADGDYLDDFDFEPFTEAFGDEEDYDEDTPPDNSQTALSNATFQRLFRATAGKLHPDREVDAEVRKDKQQLMATLLKARKKGDVMTVLEMYETYVGEHEGFSKADQKALLDSLRQMVEELEEQQEEISYQSPMHAAAYHLFYSPSKKKIELALADRVKDIKKHGKFIKSQIKSIRSLKTLKPQLEERYEMMALAEPTFEDFIDFMESEGMKAPF